MQPISLVSISISLSENHFILAPKVSKILQYVLTSLIFGRFSILQTPFISKVAGKIATAAFFAPLITTSPFSLVGPLITNLSTIYNPLLIKLKSH